MGRCSPSRTSASATTAGSRFPRSLLVPDGGGRSGTGLKPFFCWDNTGYALGRDNKGKPDRAADMFAAFRELHLSFRDELAGDEGFSALCRFLERWEPARAEQLPNWEEAAGLNVVFKLRAREGYIHQSEAVRSAWSRRGRAGQGDEPIVYWRVPGRWRRRGAGAAPPATQRRGRSQHVRRGHRLVQQGRVRELRQVAELQRPGRHARRLPLHHGPQPPARRRRAADSHRRRDGRVLVGPRRAGRKPRRFSARSSATTLPERKRPSTPRPSIASGRSWTPRGKGCLSDRIQDPDAPFYVLGLSPNAARLNVRFWLTGTVQQFAERLAEHVERLEMTGARPDDPPLVIRRLLLETAREPKDIAPQLAGEVARAVLAGLPYPQALFNAVVRRVRADSEHEPSPGGDPEGLSHPQSRKGGARGTRTRTIPMRHTSSDGSSPPWRRPRRTRPRRN